MAGWEILGCGGERRAQPGAESVGRVEEVRAERGAGEGAELPFKKPHEPLDGFRWTHLPDRESTAAGGGLCERWWTREWRKGCWGRWGDAKQGDDDL